MVNRKSPYYPKAQTSVNFDQKTLELLRFLKKENYIVSISESIREMLNFALPFFINVYSIKERIITKKLKKFNINAPKKETIIKLQDIQPSAPTPKSLKGLRKRFPDIIDYKFINEKSTKINKK